LSIPYTISVIENSNEKILVLTDSNDLSIFLKQLYPSIHIEVIDNCSYLLTDLNFKSILHILQQKNKYKHFFLNFKNADIYFFHSAFAYFENWLISHLSKNNNIFYSPSVNIQPTTKNNKLIFLLNWAFLKIVYNYKSDIITTNNYTYYGISKMFLNHINSKSISLIIDNKIVLKKINNCFNLTSNNVLLLLGGILEDGNVIEKDYDIVMNQIVNIFGEKNIDLKIHPRFKVDKVLNNLKILPTLIPANLIVDNYTYIIGYDTSTLFYGANNSIKSISLLNLIKSKNESKKNDLISYLKLNTNYKSRIYFPKTIDDLIKITNK
jgi:hypothetical protein